MEDSLVISYKSKHTLKILFSNPLLGIYPKKLKTYAHTKTLNMDVYIAALFVTANNGKQPRRPSIGERIKCDIPDNGILFGAKKKEAIRPWKDKEES